MKIAHISIIPAFSPGIFKKIQDKSNISLQNNLNIDFYILNPIEEYHKDNLHIIKKEYTFIPIKFIQTVLFRIYKLKNIETLIDLDKYDAIVLRYPLVDGIGNKQFLNKYGSKIFTEHHSDEISELYALGRKVDIIRALIEKYFSDKFLSKVAGIIGVTDEIRHVELSKINKNIPSTVIANGININSFLHTGFVAFDNKVLKMIFVASEFAPWHGLESLLDTVRDYQGRVTIELNLVGNISNSQRQIINNISKDNVAIIMHGKLYNEKLDELFRAMNLAISSLGLSKNNMKEACTLKSREYIVRGIPFIYAYKDTDLNGNESFAKRFKEDNISIEEIIKFVEFTLHNRVEVENDMKKYAEIVSWKHKLVTMQEFIVHTIESYGKE